jgi:hypothetical protein
VITPLAGATPTKPGSATLPFFGVDVVLKDKEGRDVEGNSVSGVVCIRKPWPGIARTIYGDHERYLATYLRPFGGVYFTGDGGIRDKDGYVSVLPVCGRAPSTLFRVLPACGRAPSTMLRFRARYPRRLSPRPLRSSFPVLDHGPRRRRAQR